MILSAHQPAYLPWLGYFDKIRKSDIFIYLDTVQFEKNSFTNRNKIKTPQGPLWLTIPVKSKGHLTQTVENLLVDNTQDWKGKHLKAIHANYKKAPYFENVYPKLEFMYRNDVETLSDFCFYQLQFWVEELKIETKIVRSGTLQIESKKSDLVLEICRSFGADHYLSGSLGKNYLVEDDFNNENIKVEYQDYHHPIYPQLWGEFIPFMGVIDILMNTENVTLI